MTPELTIRTFTNDQYILDKVFYSNCYCMRGFAPDSPNRPTVVDVGAHCGYFSFAALALGAKKVYAFEPFLDNYRMLLKNIPVNQSFTPYNMGWGADYLAMEYPSPKTNYLDLAYIKTRDMLEDKYQSTSATHHIAPANMLSSLLNSLVREKIDLLKISLGEDFDIPTLPLDKVQNVCGETFTAPEEHEGLKARMLVKGFKEGHLYQIDDSHTIFLFAREKLEDMFVLPKGS